MRHNYLNATEILNAYDVVSKLYPYIPSLSHWRAWEYAAYKKYHLHGRILDLGCGDGRFFNLLWPEARDVIGVDMNPDVADLARESGIYSQVITTPAHTLPITTGTIDFVFANCSLEHMDNLDTVVAEIYRCLKIGGCLLCSVVTDKFIEWTLLSNMMKQAGFTEIASSLTEKFLNYHHIANPLPESAWADRFTEAGLTCEEVIPILPKYNSGIYHLMDALWHIKKPDGGEMGETIFSFLSANANFPTGFRSIISGLLDMELDWQNCSGAVFFARKAN